MTSPHPLSFSTESLKSKQFHFVGIGGCGMSGLARLLTNLGAEIQGTDVKESQITDSLMKDGIQVSFLQDGSLLSPEIDLLVHSAAIPPEHPEVCRGDELGIPIVTYAQMLGIVQSHHTSVCIAGTHGKSTTVSMLSSILLHSGLDPSFIVGANCNQIGGSSRVGASKVPNGALKGKAGILISESCEFNRSFHDHDPMFGLINNIEEDHLDYYNSLDEIIESFRGFAKAYSIYQQENGFLLIAHDGAHRNILLQGLHCRVETFGFHPEADYQVVFDPISLQSRNTSRWNVDNPMDKYNALVLT